MFISRKSIFLFLLLGLFFFLGVFSLHAKEFLAPRTQAEAALVDIQKMLKGYDPLDLNAKILAFSWVEEKYGEKHSYLKILNDYFAKEFSEEDWRTEIKKHLQMENPQKETLSPFIFQTKTNSKGNVF